MRVPQVPEPYSQIELRAVARGQLIRSRLMVGVGEVGFGLGLWHLACVQERVRERCGVQWERVGVPGVVDQEVLPT